jgi:transcriptional regulator with GAF, ATPase, and Fis domain
MRKELEGQLILTKAFAHMQSDTNATVQEIIERSCELLNVSSIAIYYGNRTQDGFSCIAKCASDEHRNWDYPDHSWRMAQLCREHSELSKGGYVVYGTDEYIPQMEAIMTTLQAHSMMIYGILLQGKICGSLVITTQEKRFFNEQEISYCTDVASIIQGILQREHAHKNGDIHDMDLLNTYNYMSECVFIKDVQSNQVLFANEAMENMFGIDVTGIDSRSFLPELTPIYTREGIQSIGDIRHQSFVSHVNKVMDIQELSIQWRDGRDAKVVIMREQQGGQEHDLEYHI